MTPIQYTPVEQGRIEGFKANLCMRGRTMVTDTGERVATLVQNATIMPEQDKPAQGKLPVYSVISCLAGAVKDPRAVGAFVEGDKTHSVLAYVETSGDRVTWKFEVVTDRDDYTPAPALTRSFKMAGIVTIKSNEAQFSEWIRRYAEAALVTVEAAFEAQGRLLCDRLIKLTPPQSGASIKKSLWNRNIEGMDAYKSGLISSHGGDIKAAFAQFAPFRDPDIEDLSARRVGEHRVEKDIRKVIKGVKGATMPAKRQTVIVSQSVGHNEEVAWAVRQRCQGKDAYRIYADKSGNVYGVDAEHFLPHATLEDLSKIHTQHRGKRGRVTTAGSKDVVVGRWRWLNIAVTSETLVEEFIELQKKNVGQARGGWVAGYVAFGGKISMRGWVGRHANAGKCTGWPSSTPGHINVTITNNSAWASNGDPDKVIENAIEGRERDIEKMIEKILEARWGEGAGKL